MSDLLWLVYAVPFLLIVTAFIRRRARLERKSAHALSDARASGLTEPASLHPAVDPTLCIGCGACVKACPEQPEHHVLGLIEGRAALVSPTDCIGHGACRTACPVDAITLVFGSARRGVDIPVVSPQFESTVPGVFIAGELGGMGLIRNAIVQGCEAVDAIHARRRRSNGLLDLVIVGAGPAGFAASLTAKQREMRFVTLEQDSLGGCVFQYPRAKIVMTQPIQLPLAGTMHMRATRKEDLLDFWRDVERRVPLPMRYGERVETILPRQGFIAVTTTKAEYRANAVLLATGRRGSPRRLEVPGEDLPKVVYRLIEPEQYAGQQILVVGGGDSALEAAAALAEAKTPSVVLSYRGETFARAKARNRARIAEAQLGGHLRVALNSRVTCIREREVELEVGGSRLVIPNDAVIVNAGGVLPTGFLQSIGIAVETRWGTA